MILQRLNMSVVNSIAARNHIGRSTANTMEPRKVRRGTKSCWECKRKKISCRFVDSHDRVCTNCKKRGIACISQEYPDTGRAVQFGDRLSRVEDLLRQVLEQVPDTSRNWVQPTIEHQGEREQRRSSGSNVSEPRISNFPEFAVTSFDDTWPPNPTSTALSISNAELLDVNDGHGEHKDFCEQEQLSRHVLAAFPSKQDLDRISSTSLEIPICLHGVLCFHPSDLGSKHAGLIPELWKQSSPRSHPITAAKSLLLLCCCLQNLSKNARDSLDHDGFQSDEYAVYMHKAARQLVLCRDEMVYSIDGIECLAMESMFHNNAGQLRKAWSVLRRAITIAQTLGLHRRCGQITREENLWFRLIQSDVYLSLMLGLPQATPGSYEFAARQILMSCTSIDRLQRLDTLAAARMICRTGSLTEDLDSILEIDSLLRDAASSMPPQWWLTPIFAGQSADKQFENDTLRLMHQLAHLHLVARLHLPYLLRSSSDARYEQHKSITINSAREILTRYAVFRQAGTTNNYCRGVEFLIFIASTTLCLAHIGSACTQWLKGTSQFLSHLAHQRMCDRGLLERTLAVVEETMRKTKDKINRRIVVVLRRLLHDEAEAANGARFEVNADPEWQGEADGIDTEPSSSVLRISIPWIGTVNIQRKHNFDEPTWEYLSAQQGLAPYLAIDGTVGGDLRRENVEPSGNDFSSNIENNVAFDPQGEDWFLEGVDGALFDDIFKHLNVPSEQ